MIRTTNLKSLRLLSNAQRSLSTVSTDEKKVESIILGRKPAKSTKRSSKQVKQEETDDLKALDESITRAELLSKGSISNPKDFNELPHNYAQNQHIDIESNDLNSLLWKFDAPIRYAFAYGSGVFNQGYLDKQTQTDLVFGVTYPEHWHSINMRYNPDHYSSLRYFGSGVISKFQDVGAGVYFNPYVEIDGKIVKYGVVSIDSLVKDLAQWNSFYLAGRLQKPVKILRDDTMVRFWNQQNLRSAATLAFLELPENQPFDELQFYKNITSLSYKGDIRYKLGAENPKKIDNIVEKNFQYFQQYYNPILNEIVKDKKFSFQPGFSKENANKKLEEIIFRTSTIQTAKGLFTAGISKSLKYALAKRQKAKN